MMTRIMIASKTRPGIDLESLVAKHEFSVVSKSMFTTDGRWYANSMQQQVYALLHIRRKC